VILALLLFVGPMLHEFCRRRAQEVASSPSSLRSGFSDSIDAESPKRKKNGERKEYVFLSTRSETNVKGKDLRNGGKKPEMKMAGSPAATQPIKTKQAQTMMGEWGYAWYQPKAKAIINRHRGIAVTSDNYLLASLVARIPSHQRDRQIKSNHNNNINYEVQLQTPSPLRCLLRNARCHRLQFSHLLFQGVKLGIHQRW
jgi:hypothetical protein